ncbi:MAG: hypothetical protein KO464_05265 [Candidatus Methanofastidiosum sp.]|nr:hypothetical protein [Methanofastidiosum sp.]
MNKYILPIFFISLLIASFSFNIVKGETDYDNFLKGKEAYNNESYSLAISYFSKAISLDPQNEYYYTWRGDCHYE